MKKKYLMFAVVLITTISTVSCGPRRYKCGPYRRCEIKNNLKLPAEKVFIPMNSSLKNT